MTGYRTTSGGLIDRTKTVNFQFDGKDYSGFAGDTLASALLANGVRVIGRSFKYHRPRGAWGAWFDDPNAIMNIRLGKDELPNCPATTTPLLEGMQAQAVNAFPSAQNDIKGVLDRFSRFMPAGFYYKMFMWPDWHLFEPIIRKMAGLGHLDPTEIEGYQSEQVHDQCDVLVVGAGAAGLTAAREAAAAGKSVLLVDDHPEVGGALYRTTQMVEGQPVQDWIKAQVEALEAAGGGIVLGATAFGVFDHKMVGICQERGFGKAPKLIRARAKQIIMATGAIDRPLTFANNDRPGVMSLDGASEFLARYGVLVGKNIVVLTSHNAAQPNVDLLRAAGADVQLFDAGNQPAEALGKKLLKGVKIGTQTVSCDTILSSGGYMPLVHLWRHAGGKLSWCDDRAAFVPGVAPDGMIAIGAANGTFDLEASLDEARAAGQGKQAERADTTYRAAAALPKLGSKKRQWIDFQHDVTLKDVELAARENYVSVEHLKRYTTLGMASDQGKTSNVPGLSAMAAIQGKKIPEVGTTTFRPPFVPVPLEIYRGAHRQEQFHPLKRLPLEAAHRALGAAMGEYGGWLRAGWYGDGEAAKHITAEAHAVRDNAGIMDASPLGKIEVMGSDAEAFVNFIYYNTIKTLKPGNIRYGFMLTEGGIVYDDGVVARLDDNRFIISCSSSHVEDVNALLEGWRQDGNDPDRIFVHDTTQNWATVTISGPKARDLVEKLSLGIDVSAEAFPHMSFREGAFDGTAVRVARVSFTGEVSYEISISPNRVTALWQACCDAGQSLGAQPVGLEALAILRAEKGYLVIGKDTDGETMPHDMGFATPRLKKKTAFVGDRSLHNENACNENRRVFVGFSVAGDTPLPTGAHIVVTDGKTKRSVGHVSSSYFSPTLGKPIALGLIETELSEPGTEVDIYHLKRECKAAVVSPCFYDTKGERLNA